VEAEDEDSPDAFQVYADVWQVVPLDALRGNAVQSASTLSRPTLEIPDHRNNPIPP
jgi:hypothetical protein